MVGWLWFAIGGSHVSVRLPRPHASKHIIREEKRSCCMMFKDYEGTCILKNSNNNVHRQIIYYKYCNVL